MATISGSEGTVKVENHAIAEVKSWTIEEVCDVVDSSIIGTEWRKSQATIKSCSGSIDAFWDQEHNDGQGKLTIRATAQLNLYPEGDEDTRHYFSGNAIVTGISRNASFDGLVESSFTFQGNGKLELKQKYRKRMTEKIMDRIRAHFDAKETKIIEVTEWGDGVGPLYIYSSALTLAQKNRLYKMAKDDDLGLMVEALIMKAKDAEGNCLFTKADKPELMRACDPEVLIRVASTIMETTDFESAEKNS